MTGLGPALSTQQRQKVILALTIASILILLGYIAARISPTATLAEFFDDLHWTVAYSAGALLAWWGVRWSDAANRDARRWFAYGLILWAVGQMAWNIQIASGWTAYAAPSDAFFLALGPCFVIGFLHAIRNHQARPLGMALMLDAGMLAVLVLAGALAIYLRRTASTGIDLLVLLAYPISMFAPCCMALAMIPTLRLRWSLSWLPFLIALFVNAYAWMLWIYLAQENRLESNPWVYLLFSAVPLALGAGVLNWRIEGSHDAVWERRCERFIRALPLVVVGVAAMSIGVAWSLPGIPRTVAVAIYIGAVLAMMLAAIRASLLLFERDRLLEIEKRVSELQRTFGTLFKITRGGLALLAPSGRFLEANPSCESLFGYSLGQLRTMHIDDVCEIRHSTLRGPLGLLNNDGNGVLEAEGRRCDGSTAQLELTSALIPDSGGQVFVIFRDITERKRADQELRSLAQRLFLATKSARLGIWELRLNDNTLVWDARMHELYGVDPGNFGGRRQDWEDRVHPDDRAHMRAVFANALVGSGEYRAEFRIVRPDGQPRNVETYGVVQFNAEGTAERIIGVNWDITERKQTALKQQRLEAQVRQSQKLEAIGTLASGIAHDFNNVLGAILGNTELALLDIDDRTAALTSLQETRKAAHRGRDLVRRIVAFGRPQEHQARATRLEPVLEEAVKLVRAALPIGAEIQRQFASTTPSVVVDSSQITQVVLNLCTNAYQSLPNGKGIVNVELEEQHLGGDAGLRNPNLRSGRYVCLRVRDNGCGIDPGIAERIFEPFFSTKPLGEGSGLGLYVAHNIVQAHGGAICVDSTVGVGTTFHVYLPIDSAVHAEPTTAPVAATSSAPNSRHILYVDDEEPLVFLTQRLLERFGYRVSGFTDAAAALAAFSADAAAIDLVITDYSMPGKSGTDLARDMLRIRPDARIVLVSGYLRPHEIDRARAAGIQEVILKPDTVDDLAAAVHRLLTPAEDIDVTVLPDN